MKRIVILGVVALALVGCSSDDGDGDAVASSSSTDTVVTAAPTSPPSTAAATTAPVVDAAAQLVEDCVQYVPTAVYFGNFYMKAIWDIGGGTPEGLRRVCEEMVTTDPDGLMRMSVEYHQLLAFLETSTSAPAPTPAP